MGGCMSKCEKDEKWKDEKNEMVNGIKMERRLERRVGDLVVRIVE